MTSLLANFHFIRPWCLCLIPVAAIVFLLLRQQATRNDWVPWFDADLLTPLASGRHSRSSILFATLATLAVIIAGIALSGPTFEKLPHPVEKRESALVILLDLSPSMLATDLKPSRLIAARHKIVDLLQLRKEGYTALVAYSGDAHVVAPLTDDNNTIINLIDALEPAIMPTFGSNIEDALQQALALFQQAGFTQGDILLLTDGLSANALAHTEKIMSGSPFHLTIIGVGSETGAPIPVGDGSFIKDKAGNIILPQLHGDALQKLASSIGGHYTLLQLDDRDIVPLVEGHSNLQHTVATSNREFDEWRDLGVYLVPLLLPFVLASFRRGILPLLLVTPILFTPRVHADTLTEHWHKLWRNNNQQAMDAYEQKDFDTAAYLFTDPQWKAQALYSHGDYAEALQEFEHDASAKGYYNRGNALAKSGRLPEALHAYDEALKRQPNDPDTKYNRELVEKLLKKEQQQNNNGNPEQNQTQQDEQQRQSPQNNNRSGEPRKDDRESQQAKQDDQQDTQSSPEKREAENNQQANQHEPDQQAEPGNKSAEKQQAQQSGLQRPQPDQSKASESSQAQAEMTPEQREKQKALEQWLRKVPDDPAMLLRNKFRYYTEENLRKQQRGETIDNLNGEERW